jgi:hypothetical protein
LEAVRKQSRSLAALDTLYAGPSGWDFWTQTCDICVATKTWRKSAASPEHHLGKSLAEVLPDIYSRT